MFVGASRTIGFGSGLPPLTHPLVSYVVWFRKNKPSIDTLYAARCTLYVARCTLYVTTPALRRRFEVVTQTVASREQ